MATNDINTIVEKLIEKLCSVGSPEALEHATHLAECLLDTTTKTVNQQNNHSHDIVTQSYKNLMDDVIRQGNAIIDKAMASRNVADKPVQTLVKMAGKPLNRN